MKKIAVVVPCYNEEKRLPVGVFKEFIEANDGFYFIFVNDGSRDHTERVLRDLCAVRSDRSECLSLEANSGKAEAVRRGVLRALSLDCSAVCYWDADLATPLYVLHDFEKEFVQKPEMDIILGARVKLLGRDIQRKALRHYLGRVFATTAALVLNLAVYDTQCGAKIFRVNARTQGIFDAPFKSKWIFDVELLARYLQKGRAAEKNDFKERICEWPLPVWRDVDGSKVKPTDFLVAFGDLVKIAAAYRK